MKRLASIAVLGLLLAGPVVCIEAGALEREIRLSEITNPPAHLHGALDQKSEFTWWLPRGASQLVLPISAGVLVEATNSIDMAWLRGGSPWSLAELPVLGARYGNRMLAVIVPVPHYAELVINDRVGVRFSGPADRTNVASPDVVVLWAGKEPLDVARAFREWHLTAKDIGEIPPRVSLQQKAEKLPQISALYGAPHFYLWGPALFCRQDVPKNKWLPLAKFLNAAETNSVPGRIKSHFTVAQQKALEELAKADWPMDHLTREVAAAINEALTDRLLFAAPADSTTTAIQNNRDKLGHDLKNLVNPPDTWGDGPSLTMLNALHDAGIDRAVLILSDLYRRSPRPDVAARAAELGYVFGPYDSYHSVHDPEAAAEATWETAQFDAAAYTDGRVINADGTGRAGFKGKGYLFSPSAAWPHVQQRVKSLMDKGHYSAWFVDCDATAECFDDYNPRHRASRVDDIHARRQRLQWLAGERKLVVGSEGGSVLFSDVIAFGHGVHTPYIGHLDKAFRDPQSAHFLGKYWPPEAPENMFKAVPVPPTVVTPYFDPRVRIPLYQAALGDQVITTHHWSFDSLKFKNVAATRELMELLYMVPPMYHLNHATWQERKDRIVRHVKFWAPLHQRLATAPLTRFEWLTSDRLVQRTTFSTSAGEVIITVNFAPTEQAGFPAQSATVSGLPGVNTTFQACE